MKVNDKVVKLCKIINDIKAEDIVVCNTTRLKNVVDFHIICTATSTAHVRGIADFVEEKSKEDDELKDYFREGYEQSEWVVFDFDDVFLHIFTKDVRERYSLQKMLLDGANIYSYKHLLQHLKKQEDLKIKLEQKEQKRVKSKEKKVVNQQKTKKLKGEK